MRKIILLLLLILLLCLFKDYEYLDEDGLLEQVNDNTDELSKLNNDLSSNQINNNKKDILANTSKLLELQKTLNDLISKYDKTNENTNKNTSNINDEILPVMDEINELKKNIESQNQ
tara:strand:+ start:577 stop:927 length:351 start_codon:yes stop_codon:yes gene_type:complete